MGRLRELPFPLRYLPAKSWSRDVRRSRSFPHLWGGRSQSRLQMTSARQGRNLRCAEDKSQFLLYIQPDFYCTSGTTSNVHPASTAADRQPRLYEFSASFSQLPFAADVSMCKSETAVAPGPSITWAKMATGSREERTENTDGSSRQGPQ